MQAVSNSFALQHLVLFCQVKEGKVLSVAASASARSTSGAPVDLMGSFAMQKVAMTGDTDGNGNFTSNDSAVIRRLVALH